MAITQRSDDTPMCDVNTTPLIDVMLVLLIMFIITIPIQSHSVPIDLPGGPSIMTPDPERNKLVVTADGATLWNGIAVDRSGLRSLLQQVGAATPAPELQFEPDPEARYEVVDGVLAEIKRANVASMGFVGNERYREF